MNKRNKIIFFSLCLTLSFLVLAIFFLPRQKDNWSSKKKIVEMPIVQNDEKAIIQSEQLTSYFGVFLVSLGLFFTLFFELCQSYHFQKLYFQKNKEDEPYYYLMFIKTVLGIFIADHCKWIKSQSKNINYTKLGENFYSVNVFLNQFLFDDQKNKDPVRQQARKIIISFRSNIKRGIFVFPFLSIMFSYLLSWIVNLIINFFFHGRKTWSRLKLNNLWMIIPCMDQQWKKIVTSLFLLFFLIGSSILMGFYYFSLGIFADDIISQRNLLEFFFKRVFLKFDDPNDVSFTDEIKIYYDPQLHHNPDQKEKKREIAHCNLNNQNVEDFDGDPEEIKKRFTTESYHNFLQSMEKYLSEDEKQKFFFIKKFIKAQGDEKK